MIRSIVKSPIARTSIQRGAAISPQSPTPPALLARPAPKNDLYSFISRILPLTRKRTHAGGQVRTHKWGQSYMRWYTVYER
jgi:hypothetical protein